MKILIPASKTSLVEGYNYLFCDTDNNLIFVKLLKKEDLYLLLYDERNNLQITAHYLNTNNTNIFHLSTIDS